MHTSASLEQLTGAPLPVERFLALAVRMAGERAALHGRGAIHEDIRPSSILFDAATGELSLSAPPIAGRRGLTLSEGSLPYISPEQTGQMTRADAELAVELGRRMALAIDNARLLDETRRALHLREEFLRIASHELRTPLASLRLSAQGLLRAAERNRVVSPEILDRTLYRVLGNTARLEQLTSELLDVTRIEQGRLQLNATEITLDAVVREAVDHIEAELAVAGSSVSIECSAPVVGRWDPSRLEQVVTNLLTNAAKFGAGKPIEIRIERLGDAARLAVTDHGIGIDPARRPYVFVVAHGGTITVASELGVGSTFIVTLPSSAPELSTAQLVAN